MRRKTNLSAAPPYLVAQTIAQLGSNLRTARLRRNLTVEAVAAKIGTGIRAVTDAEKGAPGTALAVYVALLWVYNLMEPLSEVADPALDQEGLLQMGQRQRARAPTTASADNDF